MCYWFTDPTPTAHEEEEMRWTLDGPTEGCWLYPFPSIFSEVAVQVSDFWVQLSSPVCFLANLPSALHKLHPCPASLPAAVLLLWYGLCQNSDIKKHFFQMPVFYLGKLKLKGFTPCCLRPPSHQILSLQISDYAPENLKVFLGDWSYSLFIW